MDDGSRLFSIRTYRIRDGQRAEFDRLFRDSAVPLLGRWGIEVVGFGPSIEDEDHYILLRAYRSLDELKTQETAFYRSDEWHKGLRDGILPLIEAYHTVVLETTAEAVEALARSLARPT